MIHLSSVAQTAKDCWGSGRPENQAHVENTQQIKLSVKSQHPRLAALCARVTERWHNRRKKECGLKMETNCVLESQITQVETTLRTSLCLKSNSPSLSPS